MNLESRNAIRAHAALVWQRARTQFLRVPPTARVVLGLFLLAALFMGLYTAFSGKDASLQLKVQHSLRNAQLSLWVDGDPAYSGSLVGYTKKKFGLIPSVQGSLSQTLAVTPGTHQIRVQITSEGGVREQTISGDFARNGQQILSVSASRADLSLNMQSLDWQSASAATEPASGSKGWFTRYAGTLMMTVAGSIISALTGFALRELPKQIASRQVEAARSLNNQPGSD